MEYTPKAKKDLPLLDLHYMGDELEVSLNHGAGAIGIEINTRDHFFTISVDNGPFKSVHNVRLGLKDEASREMLKAFDALAESRGYVKVKVW